MWNSGQFEPVNSVTDGVEGMCVDPGETGAILEAGGVGGPGLPEGGKRQADGIGQWRRIDITKCLRS
jgi:hypothetical protein